MNSQLKKYWKKSGKSLLTKKFCRDAENAKSEAAKDSEPAAI